MMSSVGEERKNNPRIGGQADKRDFVGFMENLHLPHPKQIAIALPANMKSGKPAQDELINQIAWGPVRQSYAGMLEIDPEWVALHLDELHVLDVRHPSEVHDQLGYIEGSQFIPLNELKDRLHEIPHDKPVVAICHAGTRSAQATVILSKAGYAQVANIRGGILLWQQLGLPVKYRFA
jgi:rhodanese-related sulfurtransferase